MGLDWRSNYARMDDARTPDEAGQARAFSICW